jgi:glycine/D-amino acid oxidase-like deaminating enzyme/nitrite reductase/ring-hydroxylating ferredoxin subunit
MEETRNNGNANITSGENISYWIDSSERLRFDSLSTNIETDVLVIGGGIAGLTIAYSLTKLNQKVVVLEDGYIGSGETGRTTAHLTAALDDRYYNLETVFGEDGAKLAAQSHMAAVDFIEQTVEENNIDCEFKRLDGYLFLDPSDKEENLQKEYDACVRAGLDVSLLDKVPAIKRIEGKCISFHKQGEFHIMKYLNGLAKAITDRGGKIYCKSHATKITKEGAECNGCKVTAKHIVVATNTPINNIVTMHTKQFPFRTYVIGAKIPKGSLPTALWWDTGNQDSKWYSAPYHYVRTESYDDQYDLLISGGEDHLTGQADSEDIPEEKRYNNLIGWTREKFPIMDEIVYKWSGQVLEPLDHLAFIGKNPGDDNIYIVTGDSGNGMTHGTIAGILIPDLIMKKENIWAALYSPKRLPLKVPGRYIKEVANMAAQYGDWLSAGDINGLDELQPGTGAIMAKDLKHYAVYKDEHGEPHVFSAVCPHLGCMLKWNAEEKTFDCPCHGSRFSKEGWVINGPAMSNLKEIHIEEDAHHQ